MTESRFLEAWTGLSCSNVWRRSAVGRGASALSRALSGDGRRRGRAADGRGGGAGWVAAGGGVAPVAGGAGDRGGTLLGGEGDGAGRRRAPSRRRADRHRRGGAAGRSSGRRASAEHAAATPEVATLAAKLDPPRGLARTIAMTFDASGEISDAASPELARLREERKGLAENARGAIEKLMRSEEYVSVLQDQFFTVRAERFVLPLKASAKSLGLGIVHDTSRTGETVFIEPTALVSANNRLRSSSSTSGVSRGGSWKRSPPTWPWWRRPCARAQRRWRSSMRSRRPPGWELRTAGRPSRSSMSRSSP